MSLRFYFFEDIVPAPFFSLERIDLFYQAFGKVSDRSDADFFFCPIPYECLNDASESWLNARGLTYERSQIHIWFNKCLHIAQQEKKRMLVLYYWDPEEKVELENVIFLRSSIRKSEQTTEIVIPAWHVDEENAIDEQQLFDEFQPLTEIEKISIGFRGAAAEYSLVDKMKLSINNLFKSLPAFIAQKLAIGWPAPYQLRRNLIDQLKEDKRIQADLLYGSAVKTHDRKLYRNNFISCLQQNLYSLCVRGFGNYSFRLFETMAAGRIPVIVDTDIALPLEHIIDYKELGVFVEKGQERKIVNCIADFHEKHKSSLLYKQQENRFCWKNNLSKEAFPLRLQELLEEM